LPDALFVIDTKLETIAIKEAVKLGIPVIGVADTNCDPDEIDYIIPGNDDALRAIRLITDTIAQAYLDGKAVYEAHQKELAQQMEKQRQIQAQQAAAAREAAAKAAAAAAGAGSPAPVGADASASSDVQSANENGNANSAESNSRPKTTVRKTLQRKSKARKTDAAAAPAVAAPEDPSSEVQTAGEPANLAEVEDTTSEESLPPTTGPEN